jgi:hypothetical protein
VAKVLSTHRRASASWATAATAAMSATRSIGFVGVSSHTSRVAGRISAATASRSVGGATLHSIPCSPMTRAKNRNVPP